MANEGLAVTLATKLQAADDEVATAATAAATGGLATTAARYISVGTGDGEATVIKGSAGRLYSIYAVNVQTTPAYLKIYNKATAPAAGESPIMIFLLQPSGAFPLDWVVPHGVAFSLGIGFRLVEGQADADSTEIGAGEVMMVLTYK